MVFYIWVEFNDMKRLIVFVFALVIIGSCAKNGEYTEYYSNGEIKHWELYENDFLTHYKYYDTSGNISSESKNMLLNSNSIGEYSYPHFQKSYYNGILVSLSERKPRNVDQPFDNDESPDDIIIREAFFDTTGKKQGNWSWICDELQVQVNFNSDEYYYGVQRCFDIETESFIKDLDSTNNENCNYEQVFNDILKEQAGLILKKYI